MFKIKNTKIKLLFDILIFGALWGFLEATIGTILHLDFIAKAGVYACSTTIMLPIALCLMNLSYKRNGSLVGVAGMGVIAGLIKLSLVLLLGFKQSIYMPAIYIVLESLCMMGAIAAIRPTKFFSLKTLFAFALGSTSYLISFLVLKQLTGTPVFNDMNAWVGMGEHYLLKANALLIAYVAIAGFALYGLVKLANKLNFKIETKRFDQIIFNPITASCLLALAFASTLVLR